MSDIGLRRGSVKLEPYSDSWATSYEAEKLRIINAIGDLPIEHVGSTAIPGLIAKPIIDIAVLIPDLEKVDNLIKPLGQIGYWDKGKQVDMPERRFFAKGPDANRTVYLHIVTSAEFDRMVKFRNALMNDTRLKNQYSKLKESLVARFSDDRGSYTKGKEQFIQSVLSGSNF